MKIQLAEHYGLCFGVRDAIAQNGIECVTYGELSESRNKPTQRRGSVSS